MQMQKKALYDSASLEPDLGGAGPNQHLCPGEKGRHKQTQAGRSHSTHQLRTAAFTFCIEDRVVGGGEVKERQSSVIGGNAERNG